MMSVTLGLLTGEVLPALDDYVAIQRVQLHQKGTAPCHLSGDEGGAAAAEEVQHVLSTPRREVHGPDCELHWFFGEVDHRHRVDLLDRPHVRGVGRAKESMSGSLAPAVKAPLVIAH